MSLLNPKKTAMTFDATPERCVVMEVDKPVIGAAYSRAPKRPGVTFSDELLTGTAIFYNREGSTIVPRPVCCELVGRQQTVQYATHNEGYTSAYSRTHLNAVGALVIGHGKSFPANALGMKDHSDCADFTRFLLIVATGFRISEEQEGDVKRVMFINPIAFAFAPIKLQNADESLEEYSAMINKEFVALCGTEFQCPSTSNKDQGGVGHYWHTDKFLRKFYLDRTLTLSSAYTTDLTFLDVVAKQYPDSGIVSYLSKDSKMPKFDETKSGKRPSSDEGESSMEPTESLSKKTKMFEKSIPLLPLRKDSSPQSAAPATLVRLVHSQVLPPPPVPTVDAALVAPQLAPVTTQEAPISFLAPPPAPVSLLRRVKDVEKIVPLSKEEAHILMSLPLLPRCLSAMSVHDLNFFQ